MTAGSRDTDIDWAEVRRRLEHADTAIRDALNPTAARAKAIMDERARVLAQVAASRAARGAHLDVVLFKLGNERYAIEARYVREVLRFEDFTPVPGTPDFVIGVTNLRGSVLAVIDIRALFDIAQKGLTDLSRILVLGIERVEFGILVDVAEGQVEIPTGDVVAPFETVRIQRTHIHGMTRDAVTVLNGGALLQDERLYITHD